LQGPRDYALISDKDTRHFATKPDIVIRQRGRVLLITDTKWKRIVGEVFNPKGGASEVDVYQMMAYAQVYDCDRVMLLYPHHERIGSKEGVQSCHLIQALLVEDCPSRRLQLPSRQASQTNFVKLCLTRFRGLTLNGSYNYARSWCWLVCLRQLFGGNLHG
jgi:McrBC 5-methylcytosine restriction system component